MNEKRDNPKWSLVYWMGVAVVVMAVGTWCAIDGWFRDNYEHAMINRVFAVVAFAAAVWCLCRGVGEYRSLNARAAGEGGEVEGSPPASAGRKPATPEGGDRPDESSRDKAGP